MLLGLPWRVKTEIVNNQFVGRIEEHRIVDNKGRTVLDITNKHLGEEIVKRVNVYGPIPGKYLDEKDRVIRLESQNRDLVELLKEVARLNVECCNWVYSPSLADRIDKALEKAEEAEE